MSDQTKPKPAAEEWPNTARSRDELDAALEAGVKSGVSARSFEEIIESAKSRLKNG
ncbi:MAG: hypothetical protein H6842_06220 [Rhodospirillaceae bacterium]|nr:hypothetical protein [Rhodospirillaceae bacterium]